MRRSSPTAFAPNNQNSIDPALWGIAPEQIIAILSAFVTPERYTRLQTAFRARLGNVTALMDAPYDPHNGAAIIRTLDAFGVQNLHVIERNKPFLAASSVSRGSQKWVDIHTYTQTTEAITTLRRQGFELLATHPRGGLAPDALSSIPKVCLVLGNERDGIANELTRACTSSVRVSMRGFAESLNVSVTAAILLHRAVEGRTGDFSEEQQQYLLARGLLLTVEHAQEILIAKGVFAPNVTIAEGL